MAELVVFEESRIAYRGVELYTGRSNGRDVIVAKGEAFSLAELDLGEGRQVDGETIYVASYQNMLTWERELAPARRLVALNASGYRRGFGAGNRIVVSEKDVPDLGEPTTLGGWDGIHRAMARSAAPFWYVQQSIVRELIPEGVDPADYPGIGHTGGYGPRELLRAGLFAFASQGGYTRLDLPIGADADHAIIVGRDEETLAASIAFNKLAIDESQDYTKFTVDTSHLFDFPVALERGDLNALRDIFSGRDFAVANILPDRSGFRFRYDDEEIARLGRKYWRACAVHRDVYEHVAALRGEQPFDYELSLDETPEPTAPRDLLFYLMLLTEGMGVPDDGIASAGPNIGFIKRHDFEGDVTRELWPQVNACASILNHLGAVLSVHSADGVQAATGKGQGVDEAIRQATGGVAELKVADVYQEVLWQVLAASPDLAERQIFLEAWRRTFEAVRMLSAVYRGYLSASDTEQARSWLQSPEGQRAIVSDLTMSALDQAQGAIGYGLPVFRLADALLARTDPGLPDPDAELFRRFMFLPYRAMRQPIFSALSKDGWERVANALEAATMIRIRAMAWKR